MLALRHIILCELASRKYPRNWQLISTISSLALRRFHDQPHDLHRILA